MEDAAVAEVQLSLIREVVGMLGAAGMSFWLWGGWAVDFLTGEVSVLIAMSSSSCLSDTEND